MKKELDEALCRDFPNLYRMRNSDDRRHSMRFGFSCGDGWEGTIRRLSEKIEKMILALPEADRASCFAAQVKEKFGGLRFYMTASTTEMETAISEAEEECIRTCEVCGKLGKPDHSLGWVRTECSDCRALRANQDALRTKAQK